MAEKLTLQQEQAVNDRGGKLLVSAAAGSGKTKVLVDRLLRYLTDDKDPANIDEFLIITYTKAAASELRGKIASKLTERIAENPENRHLQQQLQRLYLTQISTVHSFCADVLRQYAYRLDLSADFRVADENECRELRQTVLQQLLDDAYERAGEDALFRTFVDTQGLGRSDSLVPEIIEKVYDSARCHLDMEEWLGKCLQSADAVNMEDAGQTVWGKYLMDDLYLCLDHQIASMSACRDALMQVQGLEKCAAVLSDEVHQLELLRSKSKWDEISTNRSIPYGRLTFPRKNPDAALAEQVKAVRNSCKKDIEKKLRSFASSSDQVLQDLRDSSDAVKGLIALVREFHVRFDHVKRKRRILDFSDLEHRMLDLLLGKSRSVHTAAASEIGARYREILVDEYQDSNAVQDAIFSALTAKRLNLFMVGDVKQSIYQFRLADPQIFLEKYAAFSDTDSALPGQGRKVLLSHNFRSGGAVLNAVNDVFRTCMSDSVGGLAYGDEEALREGIPHVPLGEPEVELHVVPVHEETYPEEAAFVAQRIRELLDGTHMVRGSAGLRPITEDDIVILLRSPGSIGEHYQRALQRLGIHCTSGGSSDLLQTKEISTLRSLLQTISNPRQDIPLLAALMSPVFGFTADDVAAIRVKNKYCCIYDAFLTDEGEKAQSFVRILSALRSEARLNTLPQLLEKIFTLTGIDHVYGAMEDGEVRRSNLQAFYSLAADYSNGSRKELSQFLEHLDALEDKGLLASDENPGGAVSIMSIHKSKGLEFPVVFLCGLSREFNRESLRAQVLCDKTLGIGLSCVDRKNRVRYPAISKRAIAVKQMSDSLSEELRVLYVAMTRARDRLIMTYASRNPEGEIREMAARMDMSRRELMTSGVVCPGEWVLYTALQRTEAGALHSLGGRPADTYISDDPWRITVSEPAEVQAEESMHSEKAELPAGTIEALRRALSFQYPNLAATQAPSKQTATQRKGRLKDQEAAENTSEPKPLHSSWRAPSFRERRLQGTVYGSAVHAVMQHLQYENCMDEAGVRREVERIAQQGYIDQTQAQSIDCAKIAAFFNSSLGQRLRNGRNVLREFKFSILDEGSSYSPDLEGEHVLLQGVVDCALIEEDGITVVDFKTDYVTEQTIDSLTAYYRPQVQAYADALSRIYELPVKEACLYYFHLNRIIWL